MKPAQKSASEFRGRNSRDHPTRIPVTQFQADHNGRRDKAMTWRPRAGLIRVTEFGPKSNSVVSINGFIGPTGQLCVTVVDGANWQGYCGLIGPTDSAPPGFIGGIAGKGVPP